MFSVYGCMQFSLNELDKDISFTTHHYVLCCVFAVTILFIVNDFVLLMGLKKNHPIIMLIWLLIGGINRVVRMLKYSSHEIIPSLSRCSILLSLFYA